MSFKVEKIWVTEVGLPALVMWVHDSHRCGYVELTEDSIFYGIPNQREVHPIIQKSIDDLGVHGGVTFFDTPYWSLPNKEGSNLFVGFDCAHSGDATKHSKGTIRTLDYCIAECEDLAKQLMTVNP